MDVYVPKALRDAAELVYTHGEALDVSARLDLIAKLNTAPPARTERAVRELLKEEVAPDAQVRALKKLVDESGLQPATPPPDLPAVEEYDIRLVAWMAIDVDQEDANASA